MAEFGIGVHQVDKDQFTVSAEYLHARHEGFVQIEFSAKDPEKNFKTLPVTRSMNGVSEAAATEKILNLANAEHAGTTLAQGIQNRWAGRLHRVITAFLAQTLERAIYFPIRPRDHPAHTG